MNQLWSHALSKWAQVTHEKKVTAFFSKWRPEAAEFFIGHVGDLVSRGLARPIVLVTVPMKKGAELIVPHAEGNMGSDGQIPVLSILEDRIEIMQSLTNHQRWEALLAAASSTLRHTVGFNDVKNSKHAIKIVAQLVGMIVDGTFDSLTAAPPAHPTPANTKGA